MLLRRQPITCWCHSGDQLSTLVHNLFIHLAQISYYRNSNAYAESVNNILVITLFSVDADASCFSTPFCFVQAPLRNFRFFCIYQEPSFWFIAAILNKIYVLIVFLL